MSCLCKAEYQYNTNKNFVKKIFGKCKKFLYFALKILYRKEYSKRENQNSSKASQSPKEARSPQIPGSELM